MTALTWTLVLSVWKASSSTWNQRYASNTSRNPLQSSQCFIGFSIFYWKPVSEYAFAHPMILFYHIWLKTVWIASERNMKRRGGKREGAGQMKSPALTKITREMNKKHWRANHHYIYLENHIFSTWRKVRAEGIVRERFELRVTAAWFGAVRRRQASVQRVDYLLERTTSSRTLFSTGRASAFAMTWVWILNLDNGEVVETKL